ncbi:MAG TPA: CHRD domain-containing protein [Burkholderiales bacterium]|nr:CHRD domain-containing protein [Burkholderiales bacterium]
MSTQALKILAIVAAFGLAGCAQVQGTLPHWIPGSNAVGVKLSGAEEVPPVNVTGSGSGSFRLADDGTVTGSVSTEGVAGTAAHIHLGAKGRNGPVIVPLEKKGDTYSVPEGRKLTAAQISAWKAGELYVNVHTARHKGGEVRAQIQP